MDLRARVSNDNGATWEDITTVIAGKGKDSPEKSWLIVSTNCQIPDQVGDDS